MINNNLEKKLKTINEGEIDFVFCDYIINNMMNNKIIEKNLYQYDEDFRKNILYTPGPFLQCCLFRRDFILQHIDGFDPKSEPSEDWNFFIELSKHSPQVKHIKIFGFQWNFSQHSQSSLYEKYLQHLHRGIGPKGRVSRNMHLAQGGGTGPRRRTKACHRTGGSLHGQHGSPT